MGRVVHFEIHAENPERAVKFYESVFNWKFQKWNGPAEYWLITTGADEEPGINGGLMKRMGEIDGKAVIAYVCTVDVKALDDSLNKVKSSGGSEAMPKMAVPGVGWMAYCKDTEGNIFGMMQSNPNAK